ncbi:MAG: signal peptidase II [Gammaproteobacteria bacterium]|nr:MAG: signal peptidase II [Gammaproteobacteria bacterium]
MLVWLWLSLVVVVLDYITKLITINTMALHERIEIFSFFNITRAHNTGAAFSFLAGQGGWQRWFFATISIGVSIALVIWLKKLPKNDRWMACCLTLIIGGAIGNLYDRLVYGYVVDFLDFHGSIFNAVLGYSHFPAFNVADIAISIGAFMMAVDVVRNPGK